MILAFKWLMSHLLPATKHDIKRLERKLNEMANTLDDVLADVQSEKTVVDGISTLISGLKQQVADALSGVLTAEQQAKVDAIFAGVEANKAALSANLVANTPSQP